MSWHIAYYNNCFEAVFVCCTGKHMNFEITCYLTLIREKGRENALEGWNSQRKFSRRLDLMFSFLENLEQNLYNKISS